MILKTKNDNRHRVSKLLPGGLIKGDTGTSARWVIEWEGRLPAWAVERDCDTLFHKFAERCRGPNFGGVWMEDGLTFTALIDQGGRLVTASGAEWPIFFIKESKDTACGRGVGIEVTATHWINWPRFYEAFKKAKWRNEK